jgi:hypothetical protein
LSFWNTPLRGNFNNERDGATQFEAFHPSRDQFRDILGDQDNANILGSLSLV